MGIRRAGAAALGLVLLLVAVSIVAEDPLPVIHLKSERPAPDFLTPSSSVSFDGPAIVLASYPIRDEFTAPVVNAATVSAALDALRGAAAANDLPTFSAALTRAKELVDAMSLGAKRNAARRSLLVYRDVEQVWTFAANDRLGAFYDEESLPGFHDRIAADYPNYDAFMADYRVVDRYGRALYATAETRTFLLKQVRPAAPRPTPTPTLVARKRANVGRASARRPVPTPTRRAEARPTPVLRPADALVADMHNAAPVAPPVRESSGGRALVFIVLTLAGIGVLTMLMRTERVA
ncbi:MAG: hypothetical protein AABO58_22190 [Acidobacteriota bacterium]